MNDFADQTEDGSDEIFTPEILSEIPAWGISLAVHVAILAVIGLISIPQIVREQRMVLTTEVEELSLIHI